MDGRRMSLITRMIRRRKQWVNAENLITGETDTTLNSQGSATRAQVATILMRFVENIA